MMLQIDHVLRQAQAGDPEAVTRLYREHAPGLYSYFVVHLNGQPQQAEDLTADVFVRALVGLGRYERRGRPFRAWLFRIGHNLLMDHYRSLRRAPLLMLHSPEHLPEPAAEGALRDVADRHDLKKALRRLTQEQQVVLQLRFLHGLSVTETAAEMDKTEQAVKKLQARGLEAMRRVLAA
jgi:RNA polymerase sigma-70 factor (ECF subfamily)